MATIQYRLNDGTEAVGTPRLLTLPNGRTLRCVMQTGDDGTGLVDLRSGAWIIRPNRAEEIRQIFECNRYEAISYAIDGLAALGTLDAMLVILDALPTVEGN